MGTPLDLRAVTSLPEIFQYVMSECASVEIGMQTLLNFMKNKMFTISTSKEPAIIPKMVIIKANIINQSYSINSLNCCKI